MDDLISRQAAIDLIMETDPFWCEGMTRAIFEGVKKLPSAEKHGRWKPGREICREMLAGDVLYIDYEDWHCSCCGHRYKEYVLPYNFCPSCGAKMDVPDNDVGKMESSEE